MKERVKNSLTLMGTMILCTFIGGLMMLHVDKTSLQAGVHFYFGRMNVVIILISTVGISFIVKDAIIEAMFDDEDDFESDDDEKYEEDEYSEDE